MCYAASYIQSMPKLLIYWGIDMNVYILLMLASTQGETICVSENVQREWAIVGRNSIVRIHSIVGMDKTLA